MKAFCWVVCLFVCLSAPGRSAGAVSLKSPVGEADDLFTRPEVLRLKIELPESGMEGLKKDPKTYVRATLREGSQACVDPGLRYKGGDRAAADEKKPGFNVKFNEFDHALRFHGQRKITLDNCSNDPTYLAEILAGELFRLAGVPAPRCTFATVELNGRDLGLYVLAEGVNRDFLGRYFEMTKGNLYEGDDKDITDRLDKDAGDNRQDQADLAALAKAATESKPSQRWKRLEPLLDLDRFLSFLALEIITWHPKGYAMQPGKYRIYHDPATDRLVFLPHGLERCFTKADGPVIPSMNGLVARAVVQSSDGERRLRERISKLLATVYDVNRLQSRVDELAARIRPSVAEHDSSAVKTFGEAVARLRERITHRGQFLEVQLKETPKSRRK